MRRAVYPGSFDPFTNGHLDIVQRASSLFDEIIVLVSYNDKKHCSFTPQERVQLIEASCSHIPNVRVTMYDGLTAHFAMQESAFWLVRGIRANADFEPEFTLYHYNKEIYPQLETIVLFASIQHTVLSSSAVKTLAFHRIAVDAYVPAEIAKALRSKYHIEEIL